MTKRMPNLFVVGAPKCGTTSLCHYLSQHPDIFISPRKELHYFCPDYHYRVDNEIEYLRFFEKWNSERWAGEGSVWYLYSRSSAALIKEASPSAAIVIMVRNPVDLLYSLHKQQVYNNYESITDFEAAMEADLKGRQAHNAPRKNIFPSGLVYRGACRFTEQIERYYKEFGRENVHVVIYDDFSSDTLSSYLDVLRFLEVPRDHVPSLDRLNSRPEYRSHAIRRFVTNPPRLARHLLRRIISPKLKRQVLTAHDRLNQFNPPPRLRSAFYRELQLEFTDEVARLSDLIDRDLSAWVQLRVD